ncbi:MAG: glucosamine-6-phosphate deaminase [Thermoanaerobaculia bacterium]
MKWIVVEDYDAISNRAASRLLEAIETDPRAVLLLPTGSTPEGMYREIVSACRTRYRCFGDVTTFNLDEYVGIPPEHPSSYRSYMRERLFRHVDIDPARIHIPDGMAASVRSANPSLSMDDALDLECARYELAIAAAGGIGLALLGLGRNGHIGFNEPGSPVVSKTRVVTLEESTRDANAPFFPEGEVPRRAITAGIATILAARSIVLLAAGDAKAPAIRRLATEPPDPAFPASALAQHPNVTVIVDRAANTRG